MRDSFIFYRSFHEAIKDLGEEDRLITYDAISDYSLNSNIPELSGIPKIIFNLIKPLIDANNRRYLNGSKGGRPKKKTEEEPKPNLDESEMKANEYYNEDVDANANEDVLLPPSAPKKRKRKSQVPADFEPGDNLVVELANKYPSLKIGNEIQAFKDFHISKGTLFLDFDRAFRTWCRNALKFNPPPKTKMSEEEEKSSAWVDDQLRISEL